MRVYLDKHGEAARVSFRTFRVPGRDCRGLEAGTESGNCVRHCPFSMNLRVAVSKTLLTDSSDDELPSGPVPAESRDLNDDSDDENDRADEDHLPPAEAIAVHQGKDGAGQTANLVDRCSRETSQLDGSARIRCPGDLPT